MKEHRDTLVSFDRFDELENDCALSTRNLYLQTLEKLGLMIPKLYDNMCKEDIQLFVKEQKRLHTENVVNLMKEHVKRFYRWIECEKVNEGKEDNEKVNIEQVTAPSKVAWIKTKFVSKEIEASDLPTEKEIKVGIRTEPRSFKDEKNWTKSYKCWFFKKGQEKEFPIVGEHKLLYAMELIRQSYELAE